MYSDNDEYSFERDVTLVDPFTIDLTDDNLEKAVSEPDSRPGSRQSSVVSSLDTVESELDDLDLTPIPHKPENLNFHNRLYRHFMADEALENGEDGQPLLLVRDNEPLPREDNLPQDILDSDSDSDSDEDNNNQNNQPQLENMAQQLRRSDFLPKPFMPGQDPVGWTHSLRDYYQIQGIAAPVVAGAADENVELRLRTFKLCLSPAARAWFQSLPAADQANDAVACDALIKHYLDIGSNLSAAHQFEAATPGQGESYRSFHERLKVYAQHMGRANDQHLLANKLLSVSPPHVRESLALQGEPGAEGLTPENIVEKLNRYWQIKNATMSRPSTVYTLENENIPLGQIEDSISYNYDMKQRGVGIQSRQDNICLKSCCKSNVDKRCKKSMSPARTINVTNQPQEKPSCNFCGKSGHVMSDCYQFLKITDKLMNMERLEQDLRDLSRDLMRPSINYGRSRTPEYNRSRSPIRRSYNDRNNSNGYDRNRSRSNDRNRDNRRDRRPSNGYQNRDNSRERSYPRDNRSRSRTPDRRVTYNDRRDDRRDRPYNDRQRSRSRDNNTNQSSARRPPDTPKAQRRDD